LKFHIELRFNPANAAVQVQLRLQESFDSPRFRFAKPRHRSRRHFLGHAHSRPHHSVILSEVRAKREHESKDPSPLVATTGSARNSLIGISRIPFLAVAD